MKEEGQWEGRAGEGKRLAVGYHTIAQVFCSTPHEIMVEMKSEHHFGGHSGKI